ncbi:MAG: hypothetical protein R3222_01965 [Balneolaceae bacterium]|nr:hypothetical protein [Balneolaceae bacterium]
MEPEFIMVIAIVAIGCATGLISTWMKYQYRDNTIDSESYNQLAQAYIKHKKEMQQRVSNLENALTKQAKKDTKNFEQIEAPKKGTLTNDLQEKDKVRS